MLRYMAFAWNHLDHSQAAMAQGILARFRAFSDKWIRALEGPGLVVYYSGHRDSGLPDVLTIQPNSGLVLGRLFSRENNVTSPQPLSFLTTERCQVIVASEGRELTRSFWGDYVAFVTNQGVVSILRGPCSSLPCFRLVHNGVHVIFSYIEDCFPLGILACDFDWEYLTVLMLARVNTERTALKQVAQLQAGHRLEIRAGQAVEDVYWDALEFGAGETISNTEIARTCLRDAVKYCVHAWASCHSSILHYLSGGLDSSIILSCLKDAPGNPHITCITNYSGGADGDERDYARIAIQAFGECQHVERRRDASVRLDQMLSAKLSPVPQGYYRRVQATPIEVKLARASQATGVFSGYGGDQLFYQGDARLTVGDFLRRHGLRKGIGSCLYNAAQLDGLSVWSVLGSALREYMLPQPFRPIDEVLQEKPLLTSDAIELALESAERGGWTQTTTRASLATVRHAYAMSCLIEYYDPMGSPDDPEQVTPLLSQPLVELALKIPKHILMSGGWDRGLARQAFAPDLPPDIAWRRSKGGEADHSLELMQWNLEFIQDMLLNGLLVRNGIVDRTKVAEVLENRPSNSIVAADEIFRYLDTEVWLRNWCSRYERGAPPFDTAG